MVQKSLDVKLARIHADPHGCKDFILADAKDADMALAIGAPGRSPEAHAGELRYRSLAEFRDQSISGLMVESGANAVTLLDRNNQRHVIAHDQIRELKESQLSLMPEEVEKTMSKQELRDLIGFLKGE